MTEPRILMGVIGRPHGVRGLVRLHSYADDLTAYGPLADEAGRLHAVRWAGEGIAEITVIDGDAHSRVSDRQAAARLTNRRLYVERSRLPPTAADEFYLADLVGLAAFGPDGTALGRVIAVHDYGAGATLELERGGTPPLLVPFTRICVPEVDVAAGRRTLEPPETVDGDAAEAAA